MKHFIHLEADSYADLKAQVRELAHQHGILNGGAAAEVIAEAVAEKAEKKPASKPAPEKKKAEPVEEVVVEPVVEEVVEERAATKPKAEVTLDQTRAQVMAYVKENGQVKGKELIESFGAAKLSDVPADKLADLFAAAGGAL